MSVPYLYTLPIWVTFAIFTAVLFAALESGFRLGLRRRERVQESGAGGGNVAQSALFALLGLMIAFTYGHSVSHYETRKQVVISEANALGTAFLLAGLQRERGGGELQQALLDYARTRIITAETSGTPAAAEELLRNTLRAQEKIWPATERVVAGAGPLETTLAVAVNEVLGLHAVRLAAAFDNLPQAVLWTLLAIAAVALGTGAYTAGLSGRMCRGRMIALVFVLSAVMHLIVEFDRPLRGFIVIGQEPLLQTIAGMEAELKER